MKSDKGQFYIIVAVIIISVIAGFAVVQNYAKTGGQEKRIYDLGEELNFETGKVYDYGVYNEEKTGNLTQNWVESYHEYTKGQESVEDWVFVYGNTEELTATTFSTETTGAVGLGDSFIKINKEKMFNKTFSVKGNKNKVEIDFGSKYEFDLKEGENFFFVIRKQGKVSTKNE